MLFSPLLLLPLSLAVTSVQAGGLEWVEGHTCSDADVKMIQTAWSDAVELSKWAYKTRSGVQFSDLRRRYFGDGGSMDNKVSDRFYAMSQWYKNFWFTSNEKFVKVTCHDWFNPPPGKSKKCSGAYPTQAYTFNDPANGPVIAFCRFFLDNPSSSIAGPKYPTLGDKLKSLKSGPANNRKTCKAFSNRGSVFLHEMMHTKYIAGDPPALDIDYKAGSVAYGPYGAESLAKNDKFEAKNNADNYAMYANAVWFSYYFGDCNIPKSINSRDDAADAVAAGVAAAEAALQEPDLLPDNTPAPPGGFPVNASFAQGGSAEIAEQVYDFELPADGDGHDPITVSDKFFRILPLGDSITIGTGSSDGNGYRQDLTNLLKGNAVDMVGSFKSGKMADPDEQGIDNVFIPGITDKVGPALAKRPNVVLLHAGTIDMKQGDMPHAPDQLMDLVDVIFKTCPDATIIVAEIIGTSAKAVQDQIQVFNDAVRARVEDRAAKGQHVALAPMFGALTTTDYSDATHPNDHGYARMAQVWYDAIVEASQLGWIGVPVPVKAARAFIA